MTDAQIAAILARLDDLKEDIAELKFLRQRDEDIVTQRLRDIEHLQARFSAELMAREATRTATAQALAQETERRRLEIATSDRTFSRRERVIATVLTVFALAVAVVSYFAG